MQSVAATVSASAPLAAACIAPPAGGDDVCSLCHGWTRPGYPVCFPCRLTAAQVRWPCRRVAPVSLYRPGGVLHHALRGYKDGSGTARTVLAERVGALVARFLWEQGPRICPDGWDGIVVVPSTTGRPGHHPLESALAATWLAAQLRPAVLRRGPGGVGHREAGDDAFDVGPEAGVAGGRLLLIDDTWTTGARAQSAASALRGAGGEVPAVVVVGRVVTPVPGAPTGAWWERHVRSTSRG